MSDNQPQAILINPRPLYWVKDRDQILVVDEQDQQVHPLHSVEAAVWSWLALSYPYPKIVELLAAMLQISSLETEQRLGVIFQNWQKTGILTVEAR